MPLPSELIERLADPGARRELGRVLDALAGERAFRVERGVWTPAWTGLTVVGTPTYAGRWHFLRPLVFFTVGITAGGANTTASTLGATFINNMPIAAAFRNAGAVRDMTLGTDFGLWGIATGVNLFTPTWGATNSTIIISGWYEAG